MGSGAELGFNTVWAKSEATMLIHKPVLTSTHPASTNPQAATLEACP
ncbi:MAG: hypothetical protein JO287_06955 [Pseudonocardiales bacterium]|nr:hypothetical protein [Pseudonocardiales bacterium]